MMQGMIYGAAYGSSEVTVDLPVMEDSWWC